MKLRALRELLGVVRHWDSVFDKSGRLIEGSLDVNPAWLTGRSIAVSSDTYRELRVKINRAQIVFDEETGREFLLPRCAVFEIQNAD